MAGLPVNFANINHLSGHQAARKIFFKFEYALKLNALPCMFFAHCVQPFSSLRYSFCLKFLLNHTFFAHVLHNFNNANTVACYIFTKWVSKTLQLLMYAENGVCACVVALVAMQII